MCPVLYFPVRGLTFGRKEENTVEEPQQVFIDWNMIREGGAEYDKMRWQG